MLFLPHIKIIHRYVLREFFLVFGMSLVLFTLLLMMGRIFDVTKLIVVRGVPPGMALSLFVYTIPLLTVYTIPMSGLLGTILSVGRLNADSEITAIEAGGIRMKSLLMALLIPSIIIGWMTFYNFNDFAPHYYTVWKDITTDLSKSRPSALFEEGALVVGTTRIYVKEFDRKTSQLKDIYIYESEGKWEKTIHAGKAKLNLTKDGGLYLILERVQIIQSKQNNVGTLHIQDSKVLWYELPILNDNEFMNRIKKPKEYTIRQLREFIYSDKTIKHMKSRYQVEYHKKIALPVSVIFFVLFGFPLSITSVRYGKSGGFTLSLLIFFLYYILMSFGETLSIEYGWPVIICLWMPNATLFILGLVLNWKKGVFE